MFNAAGHVINPCLDAVAYRHQLGPAGAGDHRPVHRCGFGISILAIFSSLTAAGRLADGAAAARPQHRRRPERRSQRQLAFFLPLITILYGSIIPAGVFLYLICLRCTRSSSSS